MEYRIRVCCKVARAVERDECPNDPAQRVCQITAEHDGTRRRVGRLPRTTLCLCQIQSPPASLSSHLPDGLKRAAFGMPVFRRGYPASQLGARGQ